MNLIPASYPNKDDRKTTPLHDQVQTVLALAEPEEIRQFLLDCQPPLAPGNGKPFEWLCDGINSFNPTVTLEAIWDQRQRLHVDALISIKKQIPYVGGGEGSYLETYCVGIEIKTEIQSLGDTLRQLTRYRAVDFSRTPFVLVCGDLKESEIKVFQSQGIHVYIPGSYNPGLEVSGVFKAKISGKYFRAGSYNTFTVALATKSGKFKPYPWSGIDYLIDNGGGQIHREIINNIPQIIVKPALIEESA